MSFSVSEHIDFNLADIDILPLLGDVAILMKEFDGNRNSVTDAEKRTTSYKYSQQGQLTEITDAKQGVTKLDYGSASCPSCTNGADKLTAVRDANHVANNQPGTVYTYDKIGRVETETDPMGKKTRYTWYDSGLLKEKIDATNAAAEKLLITYSYNNRGQLTDKLYPDNTSVHFTYDANARLESAKNLAATTVTYGYTFTYHTNGRLKTVTDTNSKTISYDDYTASGQKKQVTYFPTTADQKQLTYGYDTYNRLQTIVSPAGTFTYGYDTLSRRSSLLYPNQITTTYGYDDLQRLTGITHQYQTTSIATYTYTFDQVGNRKTKTGTVNETYTYDELYRLKEAETAKGTEKYSYDPVGNRLTGPGPKDIKYQYDTANRQTRGWTYGHDYDNQGNQISRTTSNTEKTWLYTWDYENRLTKMERAKGTEKQTATFKYDPFGRRIEKKATNTKGAISKTSTWTYVYDGDDIAMEIYTNEANTTTKTFYTHGQNIDEHLALERNGSFNYYHQDGLGSVTAITDANRNVVQRYNYDSFGKITPLMNFRNSYTFTGREYDLQTGLYFYRARYYDPMDGRFVSKDPISFAGGDLNLYGYVQGNPVNWIDPSGLWGEEVHFKRTLAWAIAAGISSRYSRTIAYGDNATDGGITGAIGVGFSPVVGDQSRHFNTNKSGCDSRDVWANRQFDAAVSFYKTGDVASAFSALGRGLHSLQDKFAHRDWNTGPLGLSAHPAWYDSVTDPRNAQALINTENATKDYVLKFKNAVGYR